ncbi:MAG: tryptophan-rich sensory protein [Cyanobacteriota bacterium]
MPDWLAILLPLLLVSYLLNPGAEDFRWFLRLRRPLWLTFERWIPVIWLLIYGCFYASALLAWRAGAGGGLMAAYLLLLVMVQGYTWVICLTRRLANGTLVGACGWGVGVGGACGERPPRPLPRQLVAADSVSALEPGGHPGDLADAALESLSPVNGSRWAYAVLVDRYTDAVVGTQSCSPDLNCSPR